MNADARFGLDAMSVLTGSLRNSAHLTSGSMVVADMKDIDDVSDALALAIAVVAAFSVPTVAARAFRDRMEAVVDAQPVGSTHQRILAMVCAHIKATVWD